MYLIDPRKGFKLIKSNQHGQLRNTFIDKQGLHRLEKYLNFEGLLEKSMKIKSALKSTGKSLKVLEFYFLSVGINFVDRDLKHNKIVVPFVWCSICCTR